MLMLKHFCHIHEHIKDKGYHVPIGAFKASGTHFAPSWNYQSGTKNAEQDTQGTLAGSYFKWIT